jgi:TetR/AcrR family transcriptional regulator, repressor for uid operon
MEAQLAAVLDQAIGPAEPGPADASRERILDAALEEAAIVGLRRMTIEDVVRRAQLGRMTVYRRFPRRDDLVEALLVRECRSFLAAVAAGLDSATVPEERVAAAFVAAMRFVREHPMLGRLAHGDPGAVTEGVAAGDSLLLRMGGEFIAREIHGNRRSQPPREVARVADTVARLFLTYVALPPSDPDPYDDPELDAFAHEVLVPLIASVSA